MEHVGELSHNLVDFGNVVGSAVGLCVDFTFLRLFCVVLVDVVVLCAEPTNVFIAIMAKGLTHGALYFASVAESFPVVGVGVVVVIVVIASSLTVGGVIDPVAIVSVAAVMFAGDGTTALHFVDDMSCLIV